MSSGRNIYDFCPRCGALMKNGICTSCGYDAAKKEQQPAEEILQNIPAASRTQQPVKKHTGLIVGLCVGAAVLCFLLYVSVMMIIGGAREYLGDTKVMWEKTEEPVPAPDREHHKVEGGHFWEEQPSMYPVFEGKQSAYIPSAKDKYYEEIVDAVREDLSYQVEWEEFRVSNEEENAASCGVYPRLSGDIPNLEKLNAAIEEEVLYYMYALEEYAAEDGHENCSSQSACYVTYMDEKMISIALLEQITLGDFSYPELHEINIDVENGILIDPVEMLEYTPELARRIKKQNLVQNSGAEYISDLSDEKILELLTSYEGVIFYTPLGLEIGFNYEIDGYLGWVTVTLKDYSSFGNKL